MSQLRGFMGTLVDPSPSGSKQFAFTIGGGAPNCPCIYIDKVFGNSAGLKQRTLQVGDEIISINSVAVKGKTTDEVGELLQGTNGKAFTICYKKLHVEASERKSLDIVLKKFKHRLAENMSSTTADALGLFRRIILLDDSVAEKWKELRRTETMYRGLVEHIQRLLRAYLDLFQVVKMFGECFAEIGVHEPQARASLAFTQFANYHRQIEKKGVQMVKELRPVLSDLGTYLNKAIPDTKLTIGKYFDAKFEFLSFCLKQKEMDDEEEIHYKSTKEPLYRVQTGNYEYRLVLRCLEEARTKYLHRGSDALKKLELLDNKHVENVATQLQKFSKGLAYFYDEVHHLSQENQNVFPVEVELTDSAFLYDHTLEVLPPNKDATDAEPEVDNVQLPQ